MFRVLGSLLEMDFGEFWEHFLPWLSQYRVKEVHFKEYRWGTDAALSLGNYKSAKKNILLF